MDNCDFLCRPCHRFFTTHPATFIQWLVEREGAKRVDDLEARANGAWDRDYARVTSELKTQLARVGERVE